MSSPRCVIVRVHNFFYTYWCILQWPSYADPASTVDSLVSAAREGVVGLIHLIFSNLEMYYGQEETAEPQVYRLQPIHTLSVVKIIW